MNATNTTIVVTRSVEPLVPHSKKLRAVEVALTALRRLAAWAHPEPAAVGPMTPAQEANEAREYALKFSRVDPRFAADLRAAADRHEIGESA